MITTDELKVQLAEHAKAVKDLEEALAIEASRKRVQELEHTMSRPGFYDDAELSKKVFDEVGDLKGKLNRFEKLQGLYDDAETMLEMLDEEYDPATTATPSLPSTQAPAAPRHRTGPRCCIVCIISGHRHMA